MYEYADKKQNVSLEYWIDLKEAPKVLLKKYGSTMFDTVIIKGVHKFAYKSGGTQRNRCTTAQIRSCNELERVVASFMPYKLELITSEKSKTYLKKKEIRTSG